MFSNKIKVFLLTSICLIFFFVTYLDVKSSEIKVIDGDTIHLKNEKIRFSGIDTPEIKQICNKNNEVIKCGVQAKQLLINKIGKNKVRCVKEGVDRYKRILAECFVNNQSLSKYLVREGFAFAYRKYSTKFIEDENYAKKNEYDYRVIEDVQKDLKIRSYSDNFKHKRVKTEI